VALFATLRRFHPRKGERGDFWLSVPQGTTVDNVLEMLGIPPAEMKQTFVNGLYQQGEYVLQDKERVAIFPPIAGGTILDAACVLYLHWHLVRNVTNT